MTFSLDEQAYKVYMKQKIIRYLPLWVAFIALTCILFVWVLPFPKPWELSVVTGLILLILNPAFRIHSLLYLYSHVNKPLCKNSIRLKETQGQLIICLYLPGNTRNEEHRILSISQYKRYWRGIKVYGTIISEYSYDHSLYEGKDEIEKKKRLLLPAYFDLDQLVSYIERMMIANTQLPV